MRRIPMAKGSNYHENSIMNSQNIWQIIKIMKMMMMITNDDKNVDDDEYHSKAQEEISFW